MGRAREGSGPGGSAGGACNGEHARMFQGEFRFRPSLLYISVGWNRVDLLAM